MQIYADVLRRPISVIDSEQGPALGSAIHAAVAAGAYPDVRGRRGAMGKVKRGRLHARRGRRRRLRPAVRRVPALHDHFGRGEARGGNARCCTGSATLREDAWPGASTRAAARRSCDLHARADPLRPGRLDRRATSRPRVPGEDLMVIKPSGVAYDELTPENMIVCDLDGNARRGRATRRPATPPRTPTSTGTCRTSAGSCTRTAPYATAWAARGEPIPCVDHRDGRRVRRRHPGRAVRAHRRRRDRPRHRRDADRPPLAGGADAQPRPVHHRRRPRRPPSRPR